MKISEIYSLPIQDNERRDDVFLLLRNALDDVRIYASRLEKYISEEVHDQYTLKMACSYYNRLSIMTMNAKIKAARENRELILTDHDEKLETLYLSLVSLGGNKYFS